MALKKRKIDILGKILFKSEMDYNDDYCYGYYDDVDWDDDGWEGWWYHEFGYLDSKHDIDPNISRRIDMRTVYSKEILRDKKLNEVLGISKEFSKITLRDIYNDSSINI